VAYRAVILTYVVTRLISRRWPVELSSSDSLLHSRSHRGCLLSLVTPIDRICATDYNHCDLTTMLGDVADNRNDGRVHGIAYHNPLGHGIMVGYRLCLVAQSVGRPSGFPTNHFSVCCTYFSPTAWATVSASNMRPPPPPWPRSSNIISRSRTRPPQVASDPSLGPGGSWSTCMQGCNKEPPADVAHIQFRSRIAFKLVRALWVY